MDLAGYLRALKKGWWLVLLVGALGGALAFAYNEQAPRMYKSSVSFYVSASPTAAESSTVQLNQLALNKVASYSQLLTSDLLGSMVAQKAGLQLSPGAVASRITVNSPLNTSLIDVSVVDSSADRAKAIADALATEFGMLIDQVDNATSSGVVRAAVVDVHVVSGPTVSRTPISPTSRTNLMLGVAGGFVIGVMLALLRVVLDKTFRDLDQLREVTGLPVIGTLFADPAAKKRPILVGGQGKSVRAESYRQLRTSLQFMSVENPVKVLVVTSAVSGEGKSTTAANLAIVYAETGKQVLLIEADMRRGRLGDYLGVEGSVGLSDLLVGDVDLDVAMQQWGPDGLTVLPGGTVPPNPSELLGSHRMIDLVTELRSRFEVIIVDCPPLLPVTDAAVASTWADGTIMVVRHARTTRLRVSSAVEVLRAVDARLLGVVVSMYPSRFAKSRAYGYYTAEDGPAERPWWKFWSSDHRRRRGPSADGSARTGVLATGADLLRNSPDRETGPQGGTNPSGRAQSSLVDVSPTGRRRQGREGPLTENAGGR